MAGLLVSPAVLANEASMRRLQNLVQLPRTPSRNCLKSPGDAQTVASQGAETAPSGPFGPPNTDQIHARSLTRNLFRQFLDGVLRSWNSALRSSTKFVIRKQRPSSRK